MSLIFNPLFFSVVFLIIGGVTSAQAEVTVSGRVEIVAILDHSTLLSHSGLTSMVADASEIAYGSSTGQNLPVLDAIPQGLGQICCGTGHTAPKIALSSTDLGAASVRLAADHGATGTHGNAGIFNAANIALASTHEPYVMLLAGIGFIIFALALHLKSANSEPPATKFSGSFPRETEGSPL